jgi:Ca2+-binding RTX toxin-like protein
MTIVPQLDNFIDGLRNDVINDVLQSDLPLVGNGLQSASSSALQFLDTLKTQIDTALSGNPSGAQAIVDALTAANIAGVSAGIDANDSNKVKIAIQESATASVPLPTSKLDFGSSAFGLDAQAAFSATIKPELNLSLSFDTSNQLLALVDTPGDELKVGVDIGIDVSEGGGNPAEAKLGPLDVKLTDKIAAGTPELNLSFGLNLPSLNTLDATVSATGAIDVDLGLETNLSTPVLPTLFADLVVHWDFLGAGTGAPSVKFEHVSVDLGSVVDELVGTFKPIIEFLNAFPLGTITDALITPLPLIDDLFQATKPALNFLDVIPTGGGDGTVNLLDLIGHFYASQGETDHVQQLSQFAEAIAIIHQLGELVKAGNDKIELGSFDLVGGAPANFTAQPDLLATLNNLVGNSGIVKDVLAGVEGVINDINPNPLKTGLSDTQGLSFPLFEHPEQVINILLPDLVGGGPVTFVKYDLPALTAQAQLGPFFFPVIGPIGITLSGEFGAGIDFAIAFDSMAFQKNDVAAGIVLSTAPVDDPNTALVETIPHRIGGSPQDFNPIGYAFAEVHAGVGVSLVAITAAVEGGLLGDVNAFLPGNDGELRLNEVLNDGCFFDPVEGTLALDLSLRVTVGYSIFSWTHRFNIAEVTLVDFSFGCDGGASDPGFSLASPSPDSVNGPDLLLNVGGRADFRSIGGHVGTDVDEHFRISNAIDSDGHLIAGALTVSAFGIMENYGTAANPMQQIFADDSHGNSLGNGNDSLIVDATVTQAVIADGGIGDDRITGGAGNDKLSGGDGFDILIGGVGDDELHGGNQDDLLEGGPGADKIDGGDGRDQVTYEHSTQSVTFHFKNVGGVDGYVGDGGEAQGDFLTSIEYIIGSNVAGPGDQIYGNPNQDNTLEGLAGNDTLIGGHKNDFLLGGAGADYMDGGDGHDGTSYVTSFGEVHIDLLFHGAFGGDATGDVLLNIEDVEGSAFDDTLFGNNAANALDGWLGDDTLDGRGGADILSGGDGNDIIYAGADGDTLDGGSGVDLLSYRNVAGPVTVNLRNGTGPNGDRIGHIDPGGTFTRFVDYSSFENLDGSNASDNLTGDLAYNIIRGLNGNDIIDGEGGNDILFGGDGGDNLRGGAGLDLADYSDSFEGVLVSLAAGLGIFSFAHGDTLQGIENLRGSTQGDILIGDGGDNEIDPNLSTFGFLATPFSPTDPATGSPIDLVIGGGGTDTLVIDYSQQDFGQGLIGGFDFGSSDTGSFRRLDFSGTSVLDGVNFSQIEALRVIGTIKDDQIFAGAGNDTIATGGGDDLIFAGTGSDRVFAQEGDDTVWYGTDANRELSFGGGGNNAVFHLDAGRGIDHLSISLGAVRSDIALVGHNPTIEFHGTNLTLPNGSAVENFEALDNVITGSGNDFVAQPGIVNNNIQTGLGSDIIMPGLGVDFVDGGFDFQLGVEISLLGGFDQPFRLIISDINAFARNAGDLLVLDYSSVGGTAGVVGSVSLAQSQLHLDDVLVPLLFTNTGTYQVGAGTEDNVSFSEIERLSVKGTNQDDTLVGTFDTFSFLGLAAIGATVRGDDRLEGLGGNDTIIGNTGDDVILGGDGNDVLIGTDPTVFTPTTFVPASGASPAHFESSEPNEDGDQHEIDTLTGGAGADLFVLGVQAGYFYASFPDETLPLTNRAVITDFSPGEGDAIQLNGLPVDYRVAQVNGETLLYHLPPSNEIGELPDQLIAEIQNFTGFDLNATYVHYVGGSGGPGVEVAAAARSMAEADPPAPMFAPTLLSATPTNLAPLSDPTPTWVTQDNNPTDLLNALFLGAPPTGLVTDSVELVGDGRAFGTFSGDPFGLGSGIVLSTGQVEDLVGPNTIDGGSYPLLVTPLNFVKIGRIGNSDIFRAELTGHGTEISSITVRDSNSKQGGSGGEASGFDVDNVVLSNTLLTNVDGLSESTFNSNLFLPRLNVFDFTAAGMVFTPGTQRPQTSSVFPVAPDLLGAVNGIIDNSFARLQTLDPTGNGIDGSISLGDGGVLGFNLLQPVPTANPLYLYIAEDGGTGEALSGAVSVSSGRIDAPTDLSTDFGLPGVANDTVSFTYKFRVAPDSNVNEVVFQFAMFSEELSEFAGSEFNDSFKILLNGVNLAHLSDGAAATVNNLQTAPFGPVDPDLILNPMGTGPAATQTHADAYTKILTFAGAVNTDPSFVNTLTIQVADVRDGLLDSGILVKAGSLMGGVSPGALSIDTGTISSETAPKVFEGGDPVSVPITIHPGLLGDLSAAVTLNFKADPQLDFGNGAGVPFSKTVNPGDPLTFDLQIKAPDDHVIEGPRFDAIDVTVHSSDPTFDNLAVAPIVVEIDDPQSLLTINDVTKAEGNVGITEFDFTITRSGGSAAFSVDFATADGTATADSGDYASASGTLAFAAGEMSKTIKVMVNGDISIEGDETFFVNLLNPKGAVVTNAQGKGTIIDDEGPDTRDLSNISANTTVVLDSTGGTVVNLPNGEVTLTGTVNNFTTGAGNDSISGNNNGDILDGGPGNDTIRGGAGNDFLIGGPGTDRLTGGLGDDTFIFRPGFGHDAVTDFNVGDIIHHDTLDLRGLGFADVASVLSSTDLGTNAVIHAGTDDVTLFGVTKTLLETHQFDILV